MDFLWKNRKISLPLIAIEGWGVISMKQITTWLFLAVK